VCKKFESFAGSNLIKSMKASFSLFLSIALLLFACQSTQQATQKAPLSLEGQAQALAHRYIITDGHIDVPIRLMGQRQRGKQPDDVSRATEGGDFDYPRAKAGGLDAPFMSIYVPAVMQTLGGAKQYADRAIDIVYGLEEKHPDQFVVVTSPLAVEKAFQKGKIALAMGMENGAPIEDSIENVAYFHKRGIRYITLTHSKDNQICDSSYDTTRTWNGLSPFGREVVGEMNRLGIMVDISHVSDSTFYQVLEMTDIPVIASHSSCRHFTPGFERNMNDDMIRRLKENGGVMQINFGSSFLDSTYRAFNDKRKLAIRNYILDHEAAWEDSATQAFIQTYDRDNPKPFATVQVVADHIDRVVQLAGIDHVGLGSDYDGVGDSLPVGLKDVSQYPNLIAELLKRGYTEEDIEKICYKNVFRVWRAVETAAR
jgi:membrane dipeptidase